jgi:hypothetical protein
VVVVEAEADAIVVVGVAGWTGEGALGGCGGDVADMILRCLFALDSTFMPNSNDANGKMKAQQPKRPRYVWPPRHVASCSLSQDRFAHACSVGGVVPLPTTTIIQLHQRTEHDWKKQALLSIMSHLAHRQQLLLLQYIHVLASSSSVPVDDLPCV